MVECYRYCLESCALQTKMSFQDERRSAFFVVGEAGLQGGKEA